MKTECVKAVEFISINSSRSVSREERKKEANEPLYLTRYE
jgi:hypothetical protein